MNCCNIVLPDFKDCCAGEFINPFGADPLDQYVTEHKETPDTVTIIYHLPHFYFTMVSVNAAVTMQKDIYADNEDRPGYFKLTATIDKKLWLRLKKER